MNENFKHFLLGVIVVLAFFVVLHKYRRSQGSGATREGSSGGSSSSGGCGCGGGCGKSPNTKQGTVSPTAGNTGVNNSGVTGTGHYLLDTVNP